jgi:hypothetical protein
VHQPLQALARLSCPCLADHSHSADNHWRYGAQPSGRDSNTRSRSLRSTGAA